MDEYILDDLTLAEAYELKYKLDREIRRLYKAGKRHDRERHILIDRYDEIEIRISYLEAAERGEVWK